MMDNDELTKVTLHHDVRRAAFWGVIEAANATFLLLFAVRYFHAGPTAKSLVTGGAMAGYLFCPWVVYIAGRLGTTTTRFAALLAIGSSIAFSATAVIPYLPVYVLGSVLGVALVTSATPLLTQMYQDNYPDKKRGQLYSRTNSIRVLSSVFVSLFIGYLIKGRVQYFQWALAAFAISAGMIAYRLFLIPSKKITLAKEAVLGNGFRYLRTDAIFRNTLIAWMMLGFGNLLALPLRVEYLANPKYGLNLSELQIAIYVGIIPGMVRLLLSPAWGYLFDRCNFFALRIAISAAAMVAILTFFCSNNIWGLILGAIIYGFSMAGADIAWYLWVTKFAPPDLVADYMSVHTFFTGIRGTIAPLVAFHLAEKFSIVTVCWLSAALIFLALLTLLPELKHGRLERMDVIDDAEAI